MKFPFPYHSQDIIFTIFTKKYEGTDLIFGYVEHGVKTKDMNMMYFENKESGKFSSTLNCTLRYYRYTLRAFVILIKNFLSLRKKILK